MALNSRYTEEQICKMDIRDFLAQANFDDIFYSTRVLQVARYARESTKHEEQVIALENQVARLDTMIERNPKFVLEERHKFTEYGISGRQVNDRIAFNMMLDSASRHEFNVLIVQDVCRFARNIEQLFTNIRVLKDYGVGVLILTGNYWTYNMTETDILRLAIEAGMAQGESMRTAKRVTNGVESYRARGQLVISGMFGYIYEKNIDKRLNTLTPHPLESITVKRIFELYTHPNPEKRMGTARIADYLNENNYKTAAGDLNWSASKVVRVLKNEKYMGYMLYGKFKVADTIEKKKVATKIKPIREDVYDEEGNLIEKCNLVKGNWEPLVSEEVWWLANDIRNKRSTEFIYSSRGNIVTGLRESKNVIAQKSYCQCGYTRSCEYVHVATDGKEAQFRYTCRAQLNWGRHKEKSVCHVPAVSEVKLWLMSLRVFEYIFGDSKDEILYTVNLLKEAQKFKRNSKNGKSLQDLEAQLQKVETQIENLYLDKLSGEIDANMCKKLAIRLEEEKAEIEKGIRDRQLEESRDSKEMFDIESIERKLNTYVDFTGRKVSDELIDMFVERIIYRENDEFVWEMNLTGVRKNTIDYRIKEYSEEYANALQNDENFNIIHTFIISVEECKQFMESPKVGRRFVPKYWRPITVKIAIK